MVADKNAATVMTTNAQGEATFGGLADGTYHLVETEAPRRLQSADCAC